MHVGRGPNRIWLGEHFLIEAKTRADKDYDEKNTILKLMSRLFVDEEQHVGKVGVGHGEIKEEKDIGEVVDHMMSLEDKRLLSDIVRTAWKKSMEGKMPWEPLLEGGTVGQSPKMIKFFESLREFAVNDLKRTALVYGADGHGKTKVVDAVQEMMMIGDSTKVVKIDCTFFEGLTADKVYEILLENREKKKLLVLDNFDKLKRGADSTKMLLSLLKNVRKGETQLYLGQFEPIDLTGLKILCVAGTSGSEGLRFRGYDLITCLEKLEILEEFQEKINLPALVDREDDILRMAEYFNNEESKRRQVDYAPMDKFVGGMIKKMMETSNAITIWDIKDLMENIVKNRAILLKRKELPKDSPYLENWQEICGEYFSDTVITVADLFYLGKLTLGGIGFLESPLSKKERIKENYSEREELLPYFKELAPGKDEEGNPIGFYKGKRGEQPGLPRGGRGFPSYPKHPELFKDVIKPAGENVQHKKKINTLVEYANKVGKLLAPPVSHYTLFTAYDLATDREYDEDIKEYGSRFKLERISTDKPEDIVEKVLDVIDEKGLSGENIIVQLPEEFALNRYDIDELIDAAPGIKFMVIDTKGIKEEPLEKDRKQYRNVIYSMMRLARNIDENSSPMVSSLLSYFVDDCFDNTMDSSSYRATLIGTYLDNLSRNRISNILDVVLSYKYMTKHKLPNRALIAKTLVSV